MIALKSLTSKLSPPDFFLSLLNAALVLAILQATSLSRRVDLERVQLRYINLLTIFSFPLLTMIDGFVYSLQGAG